MTKNSPSDVLQQIENHYASLSPSGKAIAHYIQQNPIAVLSQSTSLIAEKRGRQRPQSVASFASWVLTRTSKLKRRLFSYVSKACLL